MGLDSPCGGRGLTKMEEAQQKPCRGFPKPNNNPSKLRQYLSSSASPPSPPLPPSPPPSPPPLPPSPSIHFPNAPGRRLARETSVLVMLSLTRRCVRLCPSLGPRPSACCTGPHFPTHFMGPRSSAPVMRPRSSAHFGRPRIAQRDWQGTATQQTVFSVEGGRLTRQRSAGSGLALQLLRFPSKVLWQYVAAPLLPAGYPNSVGSGYLEYSLWTGVQYLTGTMTGVLSMQVCPGAADHVTMRPAVADDRMRGQRNIDRSRGGFS